MNRRSTLAFISQLSSAFLIEDASAHAYFSGPTAPAHDPHHAQVACACATLWPKSTLPSAPKDHCKEEAAGLRLLTCRTRCSCMTCKHAAANAECVWTMQASAGQGRYSRLASAGQDSYSCFSNVCQGGCRLIDQRWLRWLLHERTSASSVSAASGGPRKASIDAFGVPPPPSSAIATTTTKVAHSG